MNAAMMPLDRAATTIRKVPQRLCPICDSEGEATYQGLTDTLYGAPGTWDMKRCLNRDCGAYWLSEMPHPDDLWMAYRGYYTHQPDPTPVESYRSRIRETVVARKFGYPGRRNAFTALTDAALMSLFPRRFEPAFYQRFHLPWHPGGRLLEIGCGAGNQLAALKAVGWSVSGVDFDPQAVEIAKARGLNVRLGDVRDLHLDAASFDAIVMGHVIEHVYRPVELLAECMRLLSPGGTVVVITPNAGSFGHRAFRGAWRGLEPPRHLVVFTPKALQLAFRKAGLNAQRTLFSARDAANMLQTSRNIRDVQQGRAKIVEAPGSRSPTRLRWVEHLERLGARIQRDWAEEQILLGHKPPDSPASATERV